MPALSPYAHSPAPSGRTPFPVSATHRRATTRADAVGTLRTDADRTRATGSSARPWLGYMPPDPAPSPDAPATSPPSPGPEAAPNAPGSPPKAPSPWLGSTPGWVPGPKFAPFWPGSDPLAELRMSAS